MATDYNQTLNLPNTDFPMRAGLPELEPKILKQWEDESLYWTLMEKNEGKPLYVLHDGPPYANGDIHMGTALNKVLKDFVVRYKNMAGFRSPYLPGWDTHGLPIELQARKKLSGKGADLSPIELRKACQEFAMQYMDLQRSSFKRLGSIGQYEDPYLTLSKTYEARQIEVFGEMAKKGYIYKGLKPVHWCPSCTTALAEAEIEYADDPCRTVYVKFPIKTDKNGVIAATGADVSKTFVVIWTTTIWTLPGNQAICLHPMFEYCVVKANGEFYIVAKELAEATMKAAGITDYEVLPKTILGKELEYSVATHPFMDGRDSLIIVNDYVTADSGTGCVHVAPGHGVEDFTICTTGYKEIPVIVPVDDYGRMNELAGPFAGLSTDKANAAIETVLAESGLLLATEDIVHQYPHCWRCKKPVLFRATEQWFCSIDGFKEAAMEAIDSVEWIPGWGRERIGNMVRDRSDWCISRQRLWGVPIPVFYCDDCGRHVIDDVTIGAVTRLFGAEGSDGWYTHEAAEILPKGYACPHCGSTAGFRKESDIMDVWFDSGTSHTAVLETREGFTWPADLYLEGGDQYRGWFQSSLLTSVAWRGVAPYKAVCTHGWVVDGEGKKMSKSLGNGILAEDVVKQYGAEILRLWVASSDYHADIRISKEILKQLSEGYRKLRNTARFILGNISDFNPDTDAVPLGELHEIDRWALGRLNELIRKCLGWYDQFEYHQVYHAVYNFCVVDMSNVYLDVLKDRLYIERKDSKSRRAAQTAIWLILDALTRLFSPILSFTMQEVWSYMPHRSADDPRQVIYNPMPKPLEILADEAFMQKWSRVLEIRQDVQKALELARTAKVIGASLDAKVTLFADGELGEFLSENLGLFKTVCIVSQIEAAGGEGAVQGEVDGLSVTVEKAAGEKCERCWSYSSAVGHHADHATLCDRCAGIVQ